MEFGVEGKQTPSGGEVENSLFAVARNKQHMAAFQEQQGRMVVINFTFHPSLHAARPTSQERFPFEPVQCASSRPPHPVLPCSQALAPPPSMRHGRFKSTLVTKHADSARVTYTRVKAGGGAAKGEVPTAAINTKVGSWMWGLGFLGLGLGSGCGCGSRDWF